MLRVSRSAQLWDFVLVAVIAISRHFSDVALFIKYLPPARQRLRCSVPNFDISLQIYNIYTQPIIDLGYFLSIASQTNKVKKTNKSMH